MAGIDTTAAVKTQSASREKGLDRPPSNRCPGLDRRYRLAPGLYRSLHVEPYERRRGDPPYRPLWIFTQDPAASRWEAAVAVVNVPFEPLAPGPMSPLFTVEDYNETLNETYQAIDLDARDVLIGQGRAPSTADPRFAQQMVYAVCSLVYATFRKALGRNPDWGFDPPAADEPPRRLRLRPHAAAMENAYYDPARGEIAFGYYRADRNSRGRHQPDSLVFTALAHDIIVHEMSHALLDGMRRRFLEPTNPDVPAFHEAFADLIALFQHFAYREVVKNALDRRHGRLDDTLLVDLARQFGQTVGSSGEALRSGLHPDEDLGDPGPARHRYDPGLDCHALSSVLVTAVFEAFRVIYRRKTRTLLRIANVALHGAAPLNPELIGLLAKEASQLAEQFLNVCIRAVDYCPPVDVTFGEYLRALITADSDLVPDDPWGYREALITAFRRRGITVPDVPDLSEEVLLWQPPARALPPIEGLSFPRLRFGRNPACPANAKELRRQGCALGEFVTQPRHLPEFGLLDPEDDGAGVGLPEIQSIRSVRRIGPDGELALELVAEITQQRQLDELTGYGGATAIIDPKGEVRYAIRKSLPDRERLQRQGRYRPSPTDRASAFRNLHKARHEPSSS